MTTRRFGPASHVQMLEAMNAGDGLNLAGQRPSPLHFDHAIARPLVINSGSIWAHADSTVTSTSTTLGAATLAVKGGPLAEALGGTNRLNFDDLTGGGAPTMNESDGTPRLMPPSDLCAGVFDVNGSNFLVLEWREARPAHAAGGMRLTEAERNIVTLLLEGHSNAAIATRRGTSARTVAKQVASAFQKMGVRSRPELFAASARGISGLGTELL